MNSENEVEMKETDIKEKKPRSPISYVIEGVIYVLLIVVCIYVVPTYVRSEERRVGKECGS